MAVGRKAYLLAGRDAAARRTPTAHTTIGTCLLAGIDPRRYVRDVLPKLAVGWLASQIAELLPQGWVYQCR